MEGPDRMTDYEKHLHEYRERSRLLREEIPDAMSGFARLHGGAMSEGALDVRTKELVALGMSITSQCTGCIAAHVDAAFRAGATRAELFEVVGVAILMGGGPATYYGGEAYDAIVSLDPNSPETEESPAADTPESAQRDG
jgi:AhpD family alkylhydroperoxidase